MCSQNASFRQKHANKWCLGLKPPTYSQIPPLSRDLPAQMLKTFIWPSILLGELQHAEEATVYHVGCSCQLLRDVALLPSPVSYIQDQNKIENYSLGLRLCITSSGSKFKRRWEELNEDIKNHLFRNSRAADVLAETACSYNVHITNPRFA